METLEVAAIGDPEADARAIEEALDDPNVEVIAVGEVAAIADRYFGHRRVRLLSRTGDPPARPLRVLLQVDDFTGGGLEQVVLDVAARLADDGNQVSLLALGKRGPAIERAQARKIRVLSLPDRGESYARMLSDEKIDLVNAHFSLHGAAQAAARGVPFVQTLHNTYVWLSPAEIGEHRAAAAHSDALICVSGTVAAYAERNLGLPGEKMIVIENGVDPAPFEAFDHDRRDAVRRDLGLDEHAFVFINVAGLQPSKAQLAIVRAMPTLLGRCPEARVVLLGHDADPAYAARLREEADRTHVRHAIVFAGHREGAADYLMAADAFLLPSFFEGFSLALAEALLSELPVIASDVGAARELIASVGGELVAPPFDSIHDLDPARLSRLLSSDLRRYALDLADAMARTIGRPEPPSISPQLRDRLDRANAYAGYTRLFRWLAGGGEVAGARRRLRW
jgi:glycosyltransferase involved in cell wall biosynthesis